MEKNIARNAVWFCLLMTFITASLHAQEHYDAIWQMARELPNDSQQINLLLDKTWENSRKNPALALEILAGMKRQYYSGDSRFNLDVWQYYQGIIHKNLGNFDTSAHYLQAYRDHHAALDNKPNIAAVQMALANLYSDQGKWAESMQAVTQALTAFQALADTSGIIKAQSKLGFLLSNLDRYDDAIDYHQRSLKMAQHQHDTLETAIAYSNIGLTYQQSGHLDSALWYFNRSLDLDLHMKDEWGLVYDYTNLANLQSQRREFDAALTYAVSARNLATKLQNSLLPFTKVLHGDILIQMGRPAAGIREIVSIIDSIPATSLKDREQAHQSLYQGYKKLGNTAKAFEHLEAFKSLSDSILNQEVTRQINALQAAYESERTKQELTLANAQRDLVALDLSSARQRNYLLLGFLILFGILAIYLYRLNHKIRQQHQTIASSLEEKDTLLREIHHRVKNNLQVISSLLSLQSRSEEDPNVVMALRQGQNRVRSMALIHQNLYEDQNMAAIKVQPYFEKLIHSLYHSYRISEDNIALDLEIAPLTLDVDTVIPLGLIVNELITNALKYAFPDHQKGSIGVLLAETGDTLTLQVRDDGVGMDYHQIETVGISFGYRLIKAFQKQLKADLDVRNEGGTAVRLTIKSYRKAAAENRIASHKN